MIQESHNSIEGEHSATLNLETLLNDFWSDFRKQEVIKCTPDKLDVFATADTSEPQLTEVEYYNISNALFPFKKLFIRKSIKTFYP